MSDEKLINHRVTLLESDVLDIQKDLKAHDERLDRHDIKFTEHTKDFERLHETIEELNKTMKEFIHELRKIKEAPVESSKYVRQTAVGAIVTTIVGILLGMIFKGVI